MIRVRRFAACLGGSAALLACLAVCSAIPASQTARAAAERTKKAEAQAKLDAVQAEIARTRAKASREHAAAGKLTRELKKAELSVAAAREALSDLGAERAQHAAKRAALTAQRKAREARVAAERTALAGEVRAAYLIGRSEPLKLLLNQRDPARAGRMLAYYGYFGRARAQEIGRIEADVKQLDALDAQLASEDQHLAELEAQQRDQLGELEQARSDRRATLASLKADARTSEAHLKRLQDEQAGLESLMRKLERALESERAAGHGAFAKLRGRLEWPVAGRVAARFGETRAGGLKWDGVLIDTQRGAEVRAVSDGRVVFADWLPGLGLLMIIDHGDGYLSLYAHNERLYKTVGARVAAGEPIAAAGDTGGSSRPELYFEIRRRGRPIDPRPWFRASAPTAATLQAAH
jgi:septal ring factor EnvC (AmiA/AmiB activator)